ncbi:MAG: 50S ribosomal protein L15 [Candidatus Pacebacteria bacterium]|nr:50S ribosomal protein L15 [Candidatus Paceibacterota bacterium]MCF7857410.1 50S ribosomal protein L15 [Candidatus Paceibacterota bacterium]
MQLHQLQPKTDRKTAKRVGRGGKRGKTSGKGGKGQTARAGGKPRPEMRDIIKRLPKLRGFGKNRARTVNNERTLPLVCNLATLESAFDAGDTVSPATLIAKGIISTKKGKVPQVKILGNGEITKKLTISGCTFSASAKEKIEKVGGSAL